MELCLLFNVSVTPVAIWPPIKRHNLSIGFVAIWPPIYYSHHAMFISWLYSHIFETHIIICLFRGHIIQRIPGNPKINFCAAISLIFLGAKRPKKYPGGGKRAKNHFSIPHEWHEKNKEHVLRLSVSPSFARLQVARINIFWFVFLFVRFRLVWDAFFLNRVVWGCMVREITRK